MKPMTGTKARPLSQTDDILQILAQEFGNPRRRARQAPIPALFAEGVDVGVQLALHWVEQELAQCESDGGSVQKVLRSMRRQARQRSCLQQVLNTSPLVGPVPITSAP